VSADRRDRHPAPGWGTATTLGYLILLVLALIVALLLQAAGVPVF
jgi:hypothetical protein